MSKTRDQSEALLGWMDSLSDATRLRLLRLLERHELGVLELCDVLQLPQSTVSRHLKVLADQAWIISRRQGTTNLYRMILDELAPSARKLWVLTREETQNWAWVEQDQIRLNRRLDEKQSEAQSFFAGAAGQWDKLRAELYGQQFPNDAIAALIPRHWTVADLGCGTGAMTQELARCVEHVIGVDQSPAMLKAAKKRTAEMANVDIRKGELEQLPISDESCDGVILALVLTYVPQPQLVLAEATRVLRPGGQMVAVDLLHHGRDDFRRQMGQHWAGFDTADLTTLITQAGLSQVRTRPLTPPPGATGPALLLASAVKAHH